MSSTDQYSRVPVAFNPGILHPFWLTRGGLYRAIQHFAPRLKGRILDFGCGAKPYRSLFTVDEYVGVDFASDGHDHSQEQIDVFYNGRKLPFPDASFDGVFSSEVFEHVFNLPEMIPEICRVLKSGGLLLLTCPFAICEHEQPNDYARYTSFAMKHMLESNGFEIVSQEKLGCTVEAIWQLRLTYWDIHILSKLRKIPVVRSIARYTVYLYMNLASQLWKAVLPKSQDLYLNNLVLARKK